jgi:hypothetical protein
MARRTVDAYVKWWWRALRPVKRTRFGWRVSSAQAIYSFMHMFS